MAGTLESKGFFAALFDFGFTSFITLKFIRVIYTVLVIAACIVGLVVFAGLANRGGVGVLLGLIFGPLVTLLYLVFARIWMETIALFFRIGENTTVMAAAASSQLPPAPPASGYGLA